jgi:hypothetical protein
MFKKQAKSQAGIPENVTYQLRDREGNVKPLFQQNRLFTWLLKKGLVSPHAPKVPFLFGFWTTNPVLVRNIVTNAGLAGIASRINGAGSEAIFNYIAIGTGATAAAAGDTTLQTEIASGGGSRAAATASRVTTSTTNDTARLVYTFTFSSSFAITESGVLNASSSGVLLCRQTFSAINVANGDSLQLTWDIQASRP